MPRPRNVPWSVVDTQTGELLCERCRRRLKIPTPCPASFFIALGKAWEAWHRSCAFVGEKVVRGEEAPSPQPEPGS